MMGRPPFLGGNAENNSNGFGVSGWLPSKLIAKVAKGEKVRISSFCSNDKKFGCDRVIIGKGFGKVEKLDCGNTDADNCKYCTVPFDLIEFDDD